MVFSGSFGIGTAACGTTGAAITAVRADAEIYRSPGPLGDTCLASTDCTSGFRAANRRGQIRNVNHAVIPQRQSASDAILQLAHIPWPIVLQETLHRSRRHLYIFAGGIAVEKTVHQLRDVRAALPQTGQAHGDNV